MEDLEGKVRRDLGRHLRHLRQASGWTLEDLVRTVERQGGSLSVSTLHRIECGKSALPLETVSLLARSLGVPLSKIEERLHTSRGRSLSLSLGISSGDSPKRVLEASRDLAAKARYWEALALLDGALAPRPEGRALAPGTEAKIHLARSFCHRKLRQYESSLDAAGRALRVEGAGEALTIRALLLHMEVHAMREEFLRARVYAEHCLDRLERLDPPARAYARLALGILEFKQGRPAEALEHLDQAQDLYASLGATLELARAEILRADCLHRLGRRLAGRRLVSQGRDRARQVSGWEVLFLGQLYEGDMDSRERAKAAAEARYRKACDVARRARLTNDLFVAWYRCWELARRFSDRALEGRAERVLQRMLRRVERRAIPEAARFLTERRPEGSPRRREND